MGDEESLSGATSTNAASTPPPRAVNRITSGEILRAMGGYHEIAGLMNKFPITAVFKRFGRLNYLNILYFQAELAILEECIMEEAQKNRESPDRECRQYFQSFRHLMEGRTETGAKDRSQWQLVLRMRKVLKQYSMPAVLNSATPPSANVSFR